LFNIHALKVPLEVFKNNGAIIAVY